MFVDSLMMGWAPIFLHITVASLLRNTGSGDTSEPAYPWLISYMSPRLIFPYLRFWPAENTFSKFKLSVLLASQASR